MAAERTTRGDLSRDRCLALLQSVQFGRVVYTVDALPAVTPVRFAVRDRDVLVRAGEDSRLARSGPGAVVALQADDIDEDHGFGWSVVVTGVATQVEGDDVPDHDRSVLGVWRSRAPGRYLRIVSTVVSGSSVEPIPLDGEVVGSGDFR